MLNRKIEFFISVVETGSFSKTAKKFYLSQSAISQQILQLEEEIGVTLFDRSGYRPVLTKAGTYFYEEGKELLEYYKKIEEQTILMGKEQKERIKIGITGPLEQECLPDIIRELNKQFSNLIIDVKKIRFEEGAQQLENGTLDLCFGITNDFNGRNTIQIENLLKHQICVICSKDHRWANQTSIEIGEIKDEAIVSFSKKLGKKFYDDFMDSFKQDGFSPNIVLEADELEELILAVKINQGIAIVSKEVVQKEQGINLLDIKNTHHQAYFGIGISKKNKQKFCHEFIRLTKEWFQKHYKEN